MEFLRKKIYIVIAIVLALVAGTIVYSVLNASAPTVPVVVASTNLPVGTLITEDKIDIKTLPASAIPENSFRDKTQVAGQTVSGAPILASDIIRTDHLTNGSSMYSTLLSMAPAGWVAIQLPQGKEQSIGLTGLSSGDIVDIYGETGTKESGLTVGCICPGAIVLAVPSTEEKDQVQNAPQYTVAVPPQYAPVIAETVVRSRQLSIALPDHTRAKPVNTPQNTPIQTAPEQTAGQKS